MAIQIDLQTSNFGIPFAGAYFRIVTSSISRQRNSQFSVMIDVVGYAQKPTNDDTKDIDFRRYHTSLADVEAQTGSTFLEKSYNWVSSQADMSGAVAV
jgi:hypothetical protein